MTKQKAKEGAMITMSTRQHVLDALQHKQPAKIPYDIRFTKNAHQKMIEFYGDPDFEAKLGNCLTVPDPDDPAIYLRHEESLTHKHKSFVTVKISIRFWSIISRFLRIPVNLITNPAFRECSGHHQ